MTGPLYAQTGTPQPVGEDGFARDPADEADVTDVFSASGDEE